MSVKDLAIGDEVIVVRSLAELSHPGSHKAHRGIITGFYPSFFNVKYEQGYEQSIMYRDSNKIILAM